MAYDAHKNFAYSTVAIAPSPASSGTTMTLASGEGALMPAVPFNLTVWPVSARPLASNAEIVRVTAISGDAITAMTRAQESTSARSIVVGDQVQAPVSVKTLTDIESAIDLKAPLVSPTFTGTPAAPTAALGTDTTQIATTAFVAAAVLGQNFKEACKYATIAALPAIVYANGSSGVGATLTGVAFGALGIDSGSPAVGERVLIKNQVSTFQNGIYTVTATGSGIAVFVLTRATDANQSGQYVTGDSCFITAGTTLSTTTWAYTGADAPTMGTDALSFVQTAGQGSFVGGNGITITGTSIAINTTITADLTSIQTLTNKRLIAPDLGTPTAGVLTNCTFPTLNQNSTGSAASLSVVGQTGLVTVTGLASTDRIKTVRDAADTLLELGGGSYTPTGTWVWTSASATWPTFNQTTTGSAAKWTTARNLAGNSVDGSANVAFANKVIVQGTVDAGLSAAQFLGALATGIVKNTTTTGALSIAINTDLPVGDATHSGAVPTPPNDTAKYLRGDMTFATVVATAPDIALSLLAPAVDETITAGYSAVVARSYKIASGKKLSIGSGARFRIL